MCTASHCCGSRAKPAYGPSRASQAACASMRVSSGTRSQWPPVYGLCASIAPATIRISAWNNAFWSRASSRASSENAALAAAAATKLCRAGSSACSPNSSRAPTRSSWRLRSGSASASMSPKAVSRPAASSSAADNAPLARQIPRGQVLGLDRASDLAVTRLDDVRADLKPLPDERYLDMTRRYRAARGSELEVAGGERALWRAVQNPVEHRIQGVGVVVEAAMRTAA